VLTGDDSQRLISHNGRGNVRELRNVAERSVLALGTKPGGLGPLLDSGGDKPKSLPDQMDAIEAVLVRAALSKDHGNIQATADALGLPRRTLNEKMRKYGLERSKHR
jgi:two-component system C4-dicarboxylate transport response regulator DctD